jgi:hypothetical protein
MCCHLEIRILSLLSLNYLNELSDRKPKRPILARFKKQMPEEEGMILNSDIRERSKESTEHI